MLRKRECIQTFAGGFQKISSPTTELPGRCVYNQGLVFDEAPIWKDTSSSAKRGQFSPLKHWNKWILRKFRPNEELVEILQFLANRQGFFVKDVHIKIYIAHLNCPAYATDNLKGKLPLK